MSGFIKLYRRILDNPVFKSDAEAMAFAWLILRASWQDTEVRYKGQIVKLERGQLTVSARDMAKALEWSKSRVSRFLNTLRERDMIEYVGGTHANVINIRNYGTFQSNSKTDGTPTGQPAGQERDSSGTQNKEGKELKELKKVSAKPKKHSIPSDWQPSDFGDGTESQKIIAGWHKEFFKQQVESFKAHHTAKGSQFVNWQSAWSTWVIGSRRFSNVNDRQDVVVGI